MPFAKLNPIDNQISSRDFIAGITGTERPNLPRSANNTNIVRWTLQQGTGDGGNMQNFPQAVSSYRPLEVTYLQSAFFKIPKYSQYQFSIWWHQQSISSGYGGKNSRWGGGKHSWQFS